MLRFVDESNLQTIDLGNGDWIKIPSKLSYDTTASIADIKGTDVEKTFKLICSMIKEWNFKDAGGNEVPVSDENIKKLDLDTFKQISEAIVPLMGMEKKDLTA